MNGLLVVSPGDALHCGNRLRTDNTAARVASARVTLVVSRLARPATEAGVFLTVKRYMNRKTL
jgi:hypothetical protein